VGFGPGVQWFVVVDEDFGVTLGPIRTEEELKDHMLSDRWPDNDVPIYAVTPEGRTETRMVPRMNRLAGKRTVFKGAMRAEKV